MVFASYGNLSGDDLFVVTFVTFDYSIDSSICCVKVQLASFGVAFVADGRGRWQFLAVDVRLLLAGGSRRNKEWKDGGGR